MRAPDSRGSMSVRMSSMPSSDHEMLLEATGERFIPELMGGELIEAEHEARYRLALPHVKGKRVLDAGCGVGWGSALMVQAGASNVVGIDLSEDAIADCRKRVPDAEFRVGDLQNLPVSDAEFDVVVCFEALEHTADTALTLDELARALAPDGLLFVSSPNPRVYPAGNPFHLHEMVPEELAEAVSDRFRQVQIFRQHLQLSSLIAAEDAHGGNDLHLASHLVQPLAPGHDAYSVAVASNAPLPMIAPIQCLAPSEQLDNLGALAAALTEERETLHADHARITAERVQLMQAIESSERERVTLATLATDAQERLKTAGEDLGSVMRERDSAVAQTESALEQLQQTQSTLRNAQSQGQHAAADRDRFARNLVDLEQELARRNSPTGGAEAVTKELRQRLDELSAHALHLEAELEATRHTLSWRITVPLRRLRLAQRARSAR
jgi:2-polyprenyl-3-methyl-5-hydroxy-6-metoxy-1,4-benzoquinol methylase